MSQSIINQNLINFLLISKHKISELNRKKISELESK